jgi:hypothetical protein
MTVTLARPRMGFPSDRSSAQRPAGAPVRSLSEQPGTGIPRYGPSPEHTRYGAPEHDGYGRMCANCHGEREVDGRVVVHGARASPARALAPPVNESDLWIRVSSHCTKPPPPGKM